MLDGHPDSPIKDGWRSNAVKDALDLCLACKGCKSDCPVDVDMATYKAEFLAHHYEGRLRPRSHYAMGWLPVLSAAVEKAHLAGVVNALAHAPLLPKIATRAAGLEPREIPLFAGESLQQWFARRGGSRPGLRGTVMLWPDTFTNRFHPHIGQAAVALLEDAGWTVQIPEAPLCCGLTWISTGQLVTAKKVLRRTIDAVADHVRAGGLVVGLEPSCTTVFRSDAPDLFPDDLDVSRLKQQTVTLAELLTEHTPGWQPPRLEGVHAMAQVHCHQHAVLKWDADQKLLEDAGAEVEHLESGCCGLAGNFGFEAGHLDVSVKCAENVLLPKLRSAPEEAVVLADGFSCRTQVHELDSGGREAIHLAELLERARNGAVRGADLRPGDRPGRPSVAARGAALGAVAAATLGGAATAWRFTARRRR
jgi:Fe-S oxidoreductase